MAAIEFRNVSKSFGSLSILKSLSLRIEKGEFIVLLGPSGCGKSTLLNITAGLTALTSGEIWIGERDVTHLDPKDRRLAMVFQSYALYPTKTVRGNLEFGLKSRGYSAADIGRRIESVANLLQIGSLLDRKPAELSGGQRQRVAIGRALVKEVDVCLFDEPLSNLDAKLRTEMRFEIKKLHSKLKNTVIYVTHDQVEAMTMATRIAVMNRGVIEQIGTPDEIYKSPETQFVAEFVGSPTINLINMSIEGHESGLVARDLSTQLELKLTDNLEMRARGKRRVRVGIRPEHLVCGDPVAIAPPGSVNLPVSYWEKIGSEALVFFEYSDRLLAARVTPERFESLAAKRKACVTFTTQEMFMFDPDTNQTLR